MSGSPGPFDEFPAVTWELIEQCRVLPRHHKTRPIGPYTILRHFPHLNDTEARSIWLFLKAEKSAGAVAVQPLASSKVEADKRKKWQVEEEEGKLRIWSIDDAVRTVDEAIAKAEIDLAVWEPVKTTVNSWPVGMKQKLPDGTTVAETVWLWQVKVELKRRIARPLEEASKILADRMRAHAPKYRVRKYRQPSDPHMLELALVDLHFGKLAWAPETGEDYDLDLAETVFQRAIDDILSRVAGRNIEHIRLPVGHDLFNYDNTRGTTEGGTPQDNDSRPAKVYGTAAMAFVHGIETCLQVAPVEIDYVRDNHSPSWSFHLLHFLHAWFHNDRHVTIHLDPKGRKYIRYGMNLLGMVHGNMSQQQIKQLPTIMAVEAPDDWAATIYREIHAGHWHRRREIQTMPLQQFGGVTYRELPSLSGTDLWHYDQGYVSNLKMADAFLWPKDRPLSDILPTYIDLKSLS